MVNIVLINDLSLVDNDAILGNLLVLVVVLVERCEGGDILLGVSVLLCKTESDRLTRCTVARAERSAPTGAHPQCEWWGEPARGGPQQSAGCRGRAGRGAVKGCDES